jgi:hypothetical protein
VDRKHANEDILAWSKRLGRVFPNCARQSIPKAAYNEETAREFRPNEPEPTVEDLRKAVSAAHPDHGGSPEEFRKAKKRLDRARGR